MNAMLRLIRWLLSVLMLGGTTLAARAQYQFRTEVNPDGTLTVYKGQSCPPDVLVIPDNIDDRQVSRIGRQAFADCSSLTQVVIPDRVTSIGPWAFSSCISLTGITIPHNVIHLAESVFSGCDKLTHAIIGKGVTNSVWDQVFGDCPRLVAITVDPLNPTYSSLGGVLFNKNQSILIACPQGKDGRYVVPESVTQIALRAFEQCRKLTSIAVPASVYSALPLIGPHPFVGCGALAEILVDPQNANYSSSEGVLFDKHRVTLIAFPAGKTGDYIVPHTVASIGWSAFKYCSRLTNVRIPDGCRVIGTEAFFGCDGLTRITIPRSVAVLGEFAFSSCTSMISAFFEGNAPWGMGGAFVAGYSGGETPLTTYYLPGSEGWGPDWSGRPSLPWMLPAPVILTTAHRFGPSPDGFSFVISWATNVPVVVEACAAIGDAGWTPISTNTLTDGWVQFADPAWKSQPARFYRVREQ